MGVDSRHKDHDKWAEDWKLIKTLQEGQRSLVMAGTKFLPKLSGQTPAEYAAYIKRGSLFNATSKTINGLVGAIVRKKATVKVPDIIDLNDLTPLGESIDEVIRIVADELMSYAFFGILIDMPENPIAGAPPYMATYDAADILNWYTQKVGSDEKLMMVSLLESEMFQDKDDPYTFNERPIIRVCYIDGEDGKYKQQKWIKEDKKSTKEIWIKYGEEIIPKRQGILMDEIPFTFFSGVGCYPTPSKPPMLDLANLNVKHWQLSTDYYHGLHYCAIPTPWAAGFEVGSSMYIGAQKAWVTVDPQAKCGYMEFSGQGLGAIEKALDKLERSMAIAGARLLEEQKAGVEAAESIRLHQTGDNATLSSIVETIEEGLEKCLDWMIKWSGASGEAEITMNKEFASSKLTPEQITALLQAVQAGKISLDTFLYNLQTGEILPPDRTIDEEKKMIESEAPDIEPGSEFDSFGGNVRKMPIGNNLGKGE